MQLPSVQEMEAYIRQAALARGIDPDIAVRVARSEGLAPDTWQSNVRLDYGRERSYGPFQLHVAPEGRKPGLGNAFIKATGLDPSDPSNWRQGVDFALDNAAKGGWGPWFGAKAVGVTGMEGIRDGKALGVSPATPGTGTAMGGFAGGPSQVAARQPKGVFANIMPAQTEGEADFTPSNFQSLMARQAMEGDPSQKKRLLKAIGLDPTGSTRVNPRGMDNPGLLELLKARAAAEPSQKGGIFELLKASIPGASQSPQNSLLGSTGGLLSKILGAIF